MTRKVMLISGTSKGIGRHLAEHYLSRGFEVIGCSRNELKLDSSHYKHFSLSITNESAVTDMFSSIRQEYGRLDYLINNAAINPAISPALLTPLSTVRKTLEVNFLGSFLLSTEAVKLMMKNRFGRIVNFSSMAASHHVAGETAYTSSKAAIVAFSRIFAKEIYRFGITCNVVSPAAVPTELSAAVNEQALKEVLKRNAIPKFGTLEEVAHTIDYLIDDKSTAITGQTVHLGGV